MWQCGDSSVCCAAGKWSEESKAGVRGCHRSARCDPQKSGGGAATRVDHEQHRKGHPAGGGTGMTNMKLNDFLWDYVGGGAAVDEDHNLTVEVFFHKPDDYVQDQQPFDEIHNLTEYQGLEGRGILLEATTKLEEEGVFILKEWRNLGRRFTVTLLAREKLNKAFTQVLKEKMVEEKGRA
ncbi:putative retrotransposon hot spot protein (RHS) [Trypanosoma cruzi]|uniref:Putative retrotransposon hot spot protein (RHS) n=1 Tax=Trypanosoma cruzi TaxID=5693 RepID=A0A2V2VBQ1_TRYCR|nr:putative retrotransposon hot spot protein (RHS) [Trypanosoma cruzi]